MIIVTTENGTNYHIDELNKTITRKGLVSEYVEIGSHTQQFYVRDINNVFTPDEYLIGQYLGVVSKDGNGGSWQTSKIISVA
jgi:hypothetical protein